MELGVEEGAVGVPFGVLFPRYVLHLLVVVGLEMVERGAFFGRPVVAFLDVGHVSPESLLDLGGVGVSEERLRLHFIVDANFLNRVLIEKLLHDLPNDPHRHAHIDVIEREQSRPEVSPQELRVGIHHTHKREEALFI